MPVSIRRVRRLFVAALVLVCVVVGGAYLYLRHRVINGLKQIPGMTPSLLDLPPGCPFRERCPNAQSDCVRTPLMRPLTAGQSVRCHHPLA